MRRALAIAIALGAAACGRSESKKDRAPNPMSPQGVTPDRVPIARPSRVPAYVTLGELTSKHPAITGARVVAPLALDESGKQALATACITGADAEAAATAIVDQYTASGWKPPTVQKSGFAADFDIADGAIHVQGNVRKAAACHDDELAVELSYTKMVPLEHGAGPPQTPSGDRVPPPPPR